MAFKEFVRQSEIRTEHASVSALIAAGKAEGFSLQKSKKTGSIIQRSKNDNAQLVFLTKDNQAVFVRISDNALDSISQGSNPMQLPVYKVNIHEDGDPSKAIVGKMMVIGVEATGNQDWEAVTDAELKSAFVVTKA